MKKNIKFTSAENSCILHLEKELDKENCLKIYNNAFKEYVNQNLKDGEISFSKISFQSFLNEENYREFKKLKFEYCNFYKNFHFAESEKVFFERCCFFIDWKYINYKNLHTESKYLFNYCKFNKKMRNGTSFVGNSKKIYTSKLFQNCEFYGDILIDKGIFNENIFNNCKFCDIDLVISNSIVEKRFNLNDDESEKYKFKLINLKNTIFIDKVKIQFCNVKDVNFFNTRFQDLADFYQTKFTNVNFERTDFEKISVFSETEFNCDVDFKYTKFLGKAIFRDTIIKGKLNLRNTIFDDEANFLDITSERREKKDEQFIGEAVDIKVANRETARVIKNFYDNSNNVIEANRFYKLEMVERTKEFSNMKFNDNVLFEKLVFHLHGLSSNHSQSWALSLFWIIFLGIFYTLINDFYFYNSTLDYTCGMYWSNIINNPLFKTNIFIYCSFFLFLVLFILPAIVIKHESAYIVLFGSIVIVSYIVFTKDTHLSMVSKNLNPFSIMRGNESISVSTLFFKIIIAYLIYQLIISIRQNTRRK